VIQTNRVTQTCETQRSKSSQLHFVRSVPVSFCKKFESFNFFTKLTDMGKISLKWEA